MSATNSDPRINELQTNADRIQEMINEKMVEVEVMCEEYAKIMNSLHELNGMSDGQRLKQSDIIDKLVGPGEPKTYGDCDTADDMVNLVRADMSTEYTDVSDSAKPPHTEEPGDMLSMGDNAAVWERLVKAHKKKEDNHTVDTLV